MKSVYRKMIACFSLGMIAIGVSGAAAAEPVVGVVISKMAFHPQSLTVKAGTTVVWKNGESGATYHSVISDAEGLFQSQDFFPDESWSFLFQQPGRYPYHCGPHANRMRGVVNVEP